MKNATKCNQSLREIRPYAGPKTISQEAIYVVKMNKKYLKLKKNILLNANVGGIFRGSFSGKCVWREGVQLVVSKTNWDHSRSLKLGT